MARVGVDRFLRQGREARLRGALARQSDGYDDFQGGVRLVVAGAFHAVVPARGEAHRGLLAARENSRRTSGAGRGDISTRVVGHVDRNRTDLRLGGVLGDHQLVVVGAGHAQLAAVGSLLGI